MTAFDLADVDYDTAIAGPPEEDGIAVEIALQLEDDGTVSLTYSHVPLFQLDQLLYEMGTEEGRNEVAERLIVVLARAFVGGIYPDLDDLLADLV